MRYEDLRRRYGTYVSQRVRDALTPDEFRAVKLDSLPEWLEAKAVTAHEDYRNLLNHPLAAPESESTPAGEACRRWRETEDLAYTIAIAENATAHHNARAS